MFANCFELEQNTAEFAEIEVEFRAPSLGAVQELVAAHTLATDLLSAPGGCKARQNSADCDCSQGAGRRTLQDDSCADRLVESMAQNVRLIEENRRLKQTVERLQAEQHNNALSSRQRRRQQGVDTESEIALTTVNDATVACAVAPCELAGACLHDGVCIPTLSAGANAFRCSCTAEYTGQRCEACAEGFGFGPARQMCIDADECASSPCENGGTCLDSSSGTSVVPIGEFECFCTSGYSGDCCELNILVAQGRECGPGQKIAVVNASSDATHYECDCTGTGYYGPTCASDVDECLSAPCGSDASVATCVQGVNTYTCSCVGNLTSTQAACFAEGGGVDSMCDGFCATCPAGKHPDPTQSTCVYCPMNQIGVDGECDYCPHGQEVATDSLQTVCQNCPAGQHSYGELTRYTCEPCENGTQPYSDHIFCTSCAGRGTGYYSNHLTHFTCQQCPTGKTSTLNHADCKPCEPNQRASAQGVCHNCPDGTLQDTDDPEGECQPCGPGLKIAEDGRSCRRCC
eukprot:SAG31_NODE_7972_length_1551_cov_1.798898_1_plen_516_part_11